MVRLLNKHLEKQQQWMKMNLIYFTFIFLSFTFDYIIVIFSQYYTNPIRAGYLCNRPSNLPIQVFSIIYIIFCSKHAW